MRYIDDETFLIPPDSKPIVGSEAVRRLVEETIKEKILSMGNPKVGHTNFWISESGDMAVSRGHFKVVKEVAGRPSSNEGYYVTVYRKVRGKWKLLCETWNSIPKPAD